MWQSYITAWNNIVFIHFLYLVIFYNEVIYMQTLYLIPFTLISR